MSNLSRLQEWLRAREYQGMLVPSIDEYQSEFAQPATQRLAWATGFRGSMGLAIVLQDRAALFVDGRYTLQAAQDTAGLGIEIVGASQATQHRWIAMHMRPGDRLVVDQGLQSYAELGRTLRFTAEQGINAVDLPQNPIDALWGTARPSAPSSTVFNYPIEFAGIPAKEKCARLREWLRAADMDCHLLADPEDVAWLLNVRTDESSVNTVRIDRHAVPVPLSRVLVEASGGVFWFVDQSRLDPALAERCAGLMEVIDPSRAERFIQERLAGKVVGANLRRTSYKLAAIAEQVGTLKDDPVVSHWRWSKHPSEIESARRGYFLDGQAVIRFLAWLQRTVVQRTVTEMEAARKLTEFRGQIPEYKGIAFPPQSASGPSASMPHYVSSEKSDRRLNDHPIYLVDSGDQYFGCSTDNAVCIALGKPLPQHIRAHTLVVKGHIALARARFPVGTYSSQLDSLARQYLWQAGMDYGHATGHGVGNFMNIHEGPHIRREIDHPMVAEIRPGMIITNEPGYYADGDFGIRVESHLLVAPSSQQGFLEFETLSRLPIDSRLMDPSLLTSVEKQWLADYHVRIAEGYKGCLDVQTAQWLQAITDAYVEITR